MLGELKVRHNGKTEGGGGKRKKSSKKKKKRNNLKVQDILDWAGR